MSRVHRSLNHRRAIAVAALALPMAGIPAALPPVATRPAAAVAPRQPPVAAGRADAASSPAGWKLVWSDEFNREGRPDPAKWTFEEGFVRNQETQYYTRARRENARVEKGVLIIESRKERFPNAAYSAGSDDWRKKPQQAEYTSASLTTRGRAAWTYGRVEVRAKLPTGRGMWPAIWMLGTNIDKVGWPRCGEIDIMENVGFDPDVIHANIHTESYNHVKRTNKGAPTRLESPHAGFHVYSMEWTPERIDVFLDGRKYFTFANEKTGTGAWPFDEPFYLILNSAIGGGWGGQKGIDDAIFPQRFEIDYVRVYQRHPKEQAKGGRPGAAPRKAAPTGPRPVRP
jgi:beta-glucanase (GH16 family)